MRYNKMLKTRFKFYLSTYCHLHSVFRFRSDLKNPSWRTHTCGELNSSHAGQEVTLCGWKSFLRCDQFIILRDSYGTTQIICKENENFTKKYLHSLPLESVIQVKGIVQKRPKKDVNKKLPTGEIEVEAIDVKLLNSSAVKTPITSKDHDKLTDNMKYRYRYLYLRNSKMQENLRTRSQILKKMWDFLQDKHGFVHVETPTLFKRTPGGAKEFVVPTIFPGKFYALPQSPQQFKQLLMVGGLDRYFQIARCYRNEGTKADRQPEFTQIDIELSFTTVDHILSLVESLLIFSWPENKDTLKVPFPRLTYKEAMELYGSDKPDLRFEIKLEDLTEEFKDSNLHFADKSHSDPDHIVSCILLPHGSKLIKKSLLKELQSLAESQNVAFVSISVKDDHSWASSISKHINEDVKKKTDNRLLTTPGDLIILASGKSKLTRLFLGKARVKCAEYLQSTGLNIIKPNISSFAWITDFPLFLDDENGNFESAHHPFTAPHPDDIDLIYTEPYQVRSQHYDLVLNGQEVGGGSIRVHDASLQKYILEDVLKENSSDLHHLLEALSYGCPPHGGIALGIDRILAIICGCQSITDVIAFPKSLDGKDLMSGAPCEISYEEKLMYHIEPTLIDLNEK